MGMYFNCFAEIVALWCLDAHKGAIPKIDFLL